MSTKTKNILYFTGGILTATLILPLLAAIGVPSFDVALTAIFGEGNPIALLFSAVLIAVLLFFMYKLARRETRPE
ncbi:hypothetical protein [Jeotgalibacillus haloalkalitolerans]|uniref:Uncharacterized protein n=1 Tax=Jeotgalibacillus haloalkalitolerans TaxID=3104292 RepID=A0ABU5KHS3_9BACL|nr:hypothetical protein [Jeotgalibacillus sp. HH7-29]MDZ5710699.1 hypothetical protein [Jeotgalibacillus sp. HH7-29]